MRYIAKVSLFLSLSLSVHVCACVYELCKNVKSLVKAHWVELSVRLN